MSSPYFPISGTQRTTGLIQVFLYLQALDVLTTLIGFKLGAAEASPFVRVLMHAGPTAGVALSKAIALLLGGVCVYYGKRHLIRWITYWSAGLVVWNLMIILVALGH
jgi:energy-converting hydrogenase Eha subunit E